MRVYLYESSHWNKGLVWGKSQGWARRVVFSDVLATGSIVNLHSFCRFKGEGCFKIDVPKDNAMERQESLHHNRVVIGHISQEQSDWSIRPGCKFHFKAIGSRTSAVSGLKQVAWDKYQGGQPLEGLYCLPVAMLILVKPFCHFQFQFD